MEENKKHYKMEMNLQRTSKGENAHMKNKKKSIIILIATIVIIGNCVGCSSSEEPPMPYSSSDYENGEWTLEEVISNLEELGFENIEIEEYESQYVSEESFDVKVEDFSSDSWLTEYKDFEQGEPLYSWRDVKIEVTIPIPVLTVENTPELADNLAKRFGTDKDVDAWKSFMKEHNGEYIEFNGIITDWYDELWYASGISFEVSFENYEDITFSWSSISTNELGFNNDYSTGCVTEGTSAYITAKIVYTSDECCYELDSIKLIR